MYIHPCGKQKLGLFIFARNLASLIAQLLKNLPTMRETWILSLGWEDLLEEGMATHSSFLALENPHGQRSLAGYSSWGHKELDTTE